MRVLASIACSTSSCCKVDDLTNEAVTDIIDKIRGKFKSAISQLGMIRGKEGGSVIKDAGLSF